MRPGAGSAYYHNEGALMRSRAIVRSPAIHPGDEEDSIMDIPYTKSVSPIVSLPKVRGRFSPPLFSPPEIHGENPHTTGQRQLTFSPGGRTEGDVRLRSHARAPAQSSQIFEVLAGYLSPASRGQFIGEIMERDSHTTGQRQMTTGPGDRTQGDVQDSFRSLNPANPGQTRASMGYRPSAPRGQSVRSRVASLSPAVRGGSHMSRAFPRLAQGPSLPSSRATVPARRPYPRLQAHSRGAKRNAAPVQSRQPARETDAGEQQRGAVALHASWHQEPIPSIPDSKPSMGSDPATFASRPDPSARPAKKRKVEKSSTNALRLNQPLPAPAPLRNNNTIVRGLDPMNERTYLPPLANQAMTEGINGIGAESQLLWGQLERQSRELKEVNGLVGHITATLRDYEIEINALRAQNAAQDRAIEELQRQSNTSEREHHQLTTSFDALSRGTFDQHRGMTTGLTAMASKSRNQPGSVPAAAFDTDGMSAPRSRLCRGVTVLSLDDDGSDGDENLVFPTPAASFGVSIHGGDAVNECSASGSLPASGSREELDAYVKYLVGQGHGQSPSVSAAYQEYLHHQHCRPSRPADASDRDPSASFGVSVHGGDAVNEYPVSGSLPAYASQEAEDAAYQEYLDHQLGRPSRAADASDRNSSASQFIGGSTHGATVSNREPSSAVRSQEGNTSTQNTSATPSFGHSSHRGSASNQNPRSAPPLSGSDHREGPLNRNVSPALSFGGYHHGGNASTQNPSSALPLNGPTWGHSLLESGTVPREYSFAPSVDGPTSSREDCISRPPPTASADEESVEDKIAPLLASGYFSLPGCHCHDRASAPSLGPLRERNALVQSRGGNASKQASSGALPSGAPSRRDASHNPSLAGLVDEPAHGHVFDNSRLAEQTRPSNPGRPSVDRVSYTRPDWA